MANRLQPSITYLAKVKKVATHIKGTAPAGSLPGLHSRITKCDAV